MNDTTVPTSPAKKPAGRRKFELDARLAAYNGVWVFIEHERGAAHSVSWELLGEGRKLADKLGVELGAVVPGAPGEDTRKFCTEAFQYGADLCYLIEDPVLAEYRNQSYTKALTDLVNKHQPEILLLGATTLGRDLAGSVATTLQTGLTADCTELNIDMENRSLAATRPTFGGSLLCTIVTLNYRPQMATVRPGILKTPALLEGKQAPVENFTPDLKPVSTRLVRVVPELDEAAMALDTAEVVISVGMGIGGPENLPVIADLARVLDARIGGSRKVVDKGWILRQQQIGLTGKTISPKLYIAIGISGAFNHAIGMQRAYNVVAINTNPKAPIFQHATFGLVGDWKVLVPVLTRHLQKARGEMRK